MGPVFFILTLFLISFSASPARAQSLLPRATLTVGSHQVTVEIARTLEALSRGLMQRQQLAKDHGMLFVFDTPDIHCFWMKNTPLPLSIAFIDPQGRIVSIQDMQPYMLDSHCPPVTIQYALEMSQGWFARAAVSVDDTVSPLPAALH